MFIFFIALIILLVGFVAVMLGADTLRSVWVQTPFASKAGAVRFFTRSGESALAETQRRIFNTAIAAVPRSRGGVAQLTGKVIVTLSRSDAARIEGFEQVVRDELGAELARHAKRYNINGPDRVAVALDVDPHAADGTIVVTLAYPTVIDGPMTQPMPAPSAPTPALVRSDGTTFPLSATTYVIGRSARCDIVLTDPQASGQHCRIERRTDGVTLSDIGSTNGTKVNGARITVTSLAHGDKVTVGKTTFTLRAA